jgi:hypothetical protein
MLPPEFDNNLKLPLWGKLVLLHHYALGVPTNGILKNRVAAMSGTHFTTNQYLKCAFEELQLKVEVKSSAKLPYHIL